MIHHVKRATKHLIIWSLVLVAIGLTGVRLALTGVERYKAELETRISALVGTSVQLGGLSANMRGISPELVVKDINFTPLLTTENPSIHLQELRFGINLGQFLLSRNSLSSSTVTVVGATLKIFRKPNGEFAIEGLKAGKGQPLWLLQGRKYELLQSQITWQDQLKQAMPVVLENVNLAIINDGKRHRINLLAKSPESLGDGLTAILDFNGEISKPADIKGNVFVKADKLKLQEMLSPYLPLDFGLNSGIGNINLWGQWQNGGLSSVDTEIILQEAVITRKNKGNLHIENLDTRIKWQQNADQWQVDVSRFLLESKEGGKKSSQKWPDAVLSVGGENKLDSSMQTFKLYANQIDLAEAVQVVQFFRSDAEAGGDRNKLIAGAQLSGELKDFSLYAEPDKQTFAIAGWFDAISFKPVQNLPGATNLSGQIKGDNDKGQFELTSRESFINLPSLFTKPVKINEINGLFSWRQTDKEWRIASSSLLVNNPVFASESRFSVVIPKLDENPFLDMQIAFKSDNVSQATTLLPTQIMNDKLKTWLSKAFVNGKITSGEFLIYGKANEFPYTERNGVFEGSINIIDGELNYHPQWPVITGINGNLAFAQDTISGTFNHGVIEKALINKAEMLITGLRSEPMLKINGAAQGDINQALAVLQHSPLTDRVTPLMSGISVQGSTTAHLGLEIPLYPGKDINVEGKTQFNNNQMTLNRLGLTINSINGELKFNKSGVFGEKIQGIALGHPIQTTITQEAQQTLIDVTGKAEVSAVEKVFNLPRSQNAEGGSDYLLELKIPNIVDANNPFDISVKSTLEGVALNIPGLLTKTKEQQKPTVVNVKLSNLEALPIDLDFNNELKAAIYLNTRERKINSGHILLGKGDVKQRKVPGIKLEISREPLALQDWLGMAANRKAGTADININEINIHSQAAYWQKTRLGMFNLSLKRNNNKWDGQIESAFGKGKFQLPLETAGINPVVLDMESINLTALKQLKLQESGISNNNFKPLININSKKTLWQSEDLGKLVLETERSRNGIKIKKLDLVGKDEKLFMTGNWRETGIKSITHIQGKLEMSKADELFDRLNITKDLTKTSAMINFKLNWSAPPWHISLPTLQGTLDAKLKDGRILSIEPGFGRVLGILAVAQWIKRLQLDFSDIYQEGLTFNSIKGHFDVVNGNAKSKDLIIDAVPATITISGDTNLVNQTVDHVIKVVPKSLDALPIAGTIVSKIASMVGKTLTGEDPESFFFGRQYLVKGNWNDIKVSELYEKGGIIQKTWRSITEFPWDEEKK